MNRPAPKEPSMDEILSSIRQIIADNDAAGTPRRPSAQAAPPPMQAAPARPLGEQDDRDLSDMLDDIEPLALSPSQIVEEGDDSGGFSFDSILADTERPDVGPGLVGAEDVTFDAEDDLPSFDPAPARESAMQPLRSDPEPAAMSAPEPEVVPQHAAPLPDPTLTSDIADQLLE